jgi:DNA-binding MarR family transcriptional regulator
MNGRKLSSHELEAFRDAAQSLKLYRRADLPDERGESQIEELYVDPLPNDHVFNTMVKPNTTFIVGRKGTGKSTVFLRAQHDLRSRTGFVSAYVDIKTVYESSQVDPQLLNRASKLAGSLAAPEIEQLLLYRHFIGAVIKEIRVELESRIRVSVWAKVKQSVGKTLSTLFGGLDSLLDKANDDEFINVLGVHTGKGIQRDKAEQSGSDGVGAEIAVAATPAAKLSAQSSASYSTATEREREYADVLMRVFDIRQYISELRSLLASVAVEHLYIFVDDFSELPPEAMKIVVDSIIAPLNNWSDELVKFKIAAYPGRVYYGEIDKTKIDEIDLDLYALYGTTDLSVMEDKAVDFTRRLIQRRFEHYGVDVTRYFGADRGHDEIWRQLFYATMANPRNLGYVLYFMYEADLLYDRLITLKSVRDAARRYYEEKIEAYFHMRRFLQESFEERSSIFSLKELLDELVRRARDLRAYQGSSLIREVEGRPPTSHFHIVANLESLLATLELNFFLTKYFVMKDRDGRLVTVFALNYGLCQKETIEFGRPSGRREYRLYYVERVFDATPILQQYLKTNQEIRCDSCDATFEAENLPALVMYDMQCPTCKKGHCAVTNLSRRYETVVRAISEDALLPQVELGIIHALGTQNEPQVASDVAGELDCSYQLVGRRAKMLADRGLVNRERSIAGRRVFSITDSARDIYMQDIDAPDAKGD